MFYLYLHFRPDGTLFYIGKGQKRRAWDFSRSRSRMYKNVRDKYGAKKIEVLVFHRDSEGQALADEKAWIAAARDGLERIVNLADGGVGGKTYAPTPQQRAATSERRRGKVHSDETKARIQAAAVRRSADPEYRTKLSTALIGNKRGTGHVVSDAHKAALSTLKKGVARDKSILQKAWETRRSSKTKEAT